MGFTHKRKNWLLLEQILLLRVGPAEKIGTRRTGKVASPESVSSPLSRDSLKYHFRNLYSLNF